MFLLARQRYPVAAVRTAGLASNPVATVRSGNQQALLVVDVQTGVVADAWRRDERIGNVATAVSRARHAGVPVIWVQHSDEDLPAGSPEWEFAPEVRPSEGEPVVAKHYNSSFEETDLEDVLASLGVSRVVLAGAVSNWCIRATAYGALDRGYDLTLVKDAHLTAGLREEDGTVVVPAESIIIDLNVTMTWLAVPGRETTTRSAAELFAPA